MTMSLLFWLSKSSSASTSSSSSLSMTDSSASLLSLLPSSSSSIPSKILSPSSSTGQDSLLEQNHNYPQILDAPHQPCSFHFPHRSFGNKNVVKQGFNASWFGSHTWLHYDKIKDLAFCFLCMKAVKK